MTTSEVRTIDDAGDAVVQADIRNRLEALRDPTRPQLLDLVLEDDDRTPIPDDVDLES